MSVNELILSGDLAMRAGVADGTALGQVFESWRERGLTPVELTAADFIQRVYLEHDALHGQLTYRREGMDAIQTIGVLFDAIRLLARHELFSETRPKLSSGKAAIALSLEDNRIEAIHDPPHDPVVLVGLLIADACKILDGVEGEDFDPLKTLSKIMRFELGDRLSKR